MGGELSAAGQWAPVVPSSPGPAAIFLAIGQGSHVFFRELPHLFTGPEGAPMARCRQSSGVRMRASSPVLHWRQLSGVRMGSPVSSLLLLNCGYFGDSFLVPHLYGVVYVHVDDSISKTIIVHV
jgi:hypothetical protein